MLFLRISHLQLPTLQQPPPPSSSSPIKLTATTAERRLGMFHDHWLSSLSFLCRKPRLSTPIHLGWQNCTQYIALLCQTYTIYTLLLLCSYLVEWSFERQVTAELRAAMMLLTLQGSRQDTVCSSRRNQGPRVVVFAIDDPTRRCAAGRLGVRAFKRHQIAPLLAVNLPSVRGRAILSGGGSTMLRCNF